MINFREPELSDKAAADEIFHSQRQRTCDYSFGNVYIWRKFYHTQIAFINGFLVIRAAFNGRPCYIYPAGRGDRREILELIREDASLRGEKLLFSGLTPDMQLELKYFFPNQVVFTPVRAYFDYIYRAQDLITLSGKKYHGKRNHITRFQRLGKWSFEPITTENLAQCDAMNKEWYILNGGGSEAGAQAEYCAIRQALDHYDALGFTGGLLRLDGRVVAFTIGEQLSEDTFVTHFEKAYDDVEGAYPAINQMFAASCCSHYEYINREEDLGLDGLRRAKLSYQPAILLEKCLAEF